MRTMTRTTVLCVCVALAIGGVLVGGCKPQGDSPGGKTYSRVGAAAPTWGSEPKYQQMGSFLEGSWAVIVDPSAPIQEVYTFKPDGTFTIETGSKTVTGTWQENEGVVSLTHKTLNGKPWDEAIAEIRAIEEKGTQGGVAQGLLLDWMTSKLDKRSRLGVTSDGKQLTFSPPYPGEPPSEMAMMMQETMERVAASKE